MATVSWRTKSRFMVSGNTITTNSVQFVFLHRWDQHKHPESYSIWGLEGNIRTCILYFDFKVRETTTKCGINKAAVSIDFNTEGLTQAQLFHVKPAYQFRGPSAEQGYKKNWSFGPTFNTPFGGGSLGQIGIEENLEGLPDWRFYGALCPEEEDHGVKWVWIRGDHYKPARGVPEMVVGVAAKNHPQTEFHGAVTMSVQPRRSWR
ncbi:hypothetical protein PISL3812_05413 [Talaromyces islandicus]|uniref:Uncharacterized protein n=1 Tax=Talaromyces islandicus TaxID=28573 RepID=A0A0U1LYG5_TALIS|nr:hypothetical protein PISL3812_05413 [Talaromyces islandicus]